MTEPTEPETVARQVREAIERLVAGGDTQGLDRLFNGVRAKLDQVTVLDRLAADDDGSKTPRVDLDAAAPIEETRPLIERLRAADAEDPRYHELGEIARGGMGVIFRVWDRDLRRTLAKKVAGVGDTPELDPDRRARFLEEAQVTGQLDHPGIIPIHELGIDARGRVYFTMQLVQGSTLADVFSRARRDAEGWTLPRAVDALLRASEAVAYAHAKGVVHRDLKPSNVMVGGFGEVYVMDWGLAKVLDRADAGASDADVRRVRTDARSDSGAVGAETPLVTQLGSVVGTPAYMSPEQASADSGRIDARSDVYSAGAMLYELLAGHPPYAEGGPLEPVAALARLLDGPPAPLERVAPGAPAELVAISQRAMERERDARYGDMSEFASDLRAYLEGRVVRAHETGAWAELRKWVHRNRSLAAALAGAVLLAVGGAGGIAYVQSVERAVAEEQRGLAEARATRLQRFTDLLHATQQAESAESLWPRTPERVPDYDDWLAFSRGVLANLSTHEDDLASPDTPPEELAALEQAVAALGELASLTTEVDGRRRFAAALARASLSGEDAAPRWSEAVAEIADPDRSPAYGGLELAPQLGLLPLGRDPRSGLAEFVDIGTGRAPRRDAAGALEIAEDTGVVLVLVPGGRYSLGAIPPDEEHPEGSPHVDPEATDFEGPIVEVELDPFFLSKYELTLAQWQRMTGENPSLLLQVELERPGIHPVEGVSWDDATLWLGRYGLELPTMAQWEAAARAGTTTPHWTGPRPTDWSGLSNVALDRDSHDPVGSYPPNPFGLHDLFGNVFEWCRDGYVPSDEEHPRREGDGLLLTGPAASRFYRGASYGITEAGVGYFARVTSVGVSEPGTRDDGTGLRAVRRVER